jgi:hypothetical protein
MTIAIVRDNVKENLNVFLDVFKDLIEIIEVKEITEEIVEKCDIFFIFTESYISRIINQIAMLKSNKCAIICNGYVTHNKQAPIFVFLMPVTKSFVSQKAIILGYEKDEKFGAIQEYYKKQIQDMLIAAKNRDRMNCEGLYETNVSNAFQYYDLMKDYHNFIEKHSKISENKELEEMFKMSIS